MDCDRIMVLDDGRLLEMDSCANLLQQKDGVFTSLHSKFMLSHE